MRVFAQFDIFERRPSVAALSDDSSDTASPSGSRAASRNSSRAASAGTRAAPALVAQAAAAVVGVMEPARSTAAVALQDSMLVLPDPLTRVKQQSAAAHFDSSMTISGGSRPAIQSSAQSQSQATMPAAQPALQQQAGAVQTNFSQPPVNGAPLRGAMSPGVRSDDDLAGAADISSPAAAAAAAVGNNHPAPARPGWGQSTAPALQLVTTGATAPTLPAGKHKGQSVKIDSATFSAMAGLARPITIEDYAKSLAATDEADQL